ncbi:MAG: hypothetical protein RJA70_4794 [Pseudomonadota bacterium]|jgi:class 3 adenylate cyclase/YHS domain-containing protein
MCPTPAVPAEPIEATFCFVDLAGFTALTETRGDNDAADLAAGFFALTRGALGPKDALIKTIGDAVLVTCSTPAAGVKFAERLLTAVAMEAHYPSLRAGLHHGPAVVRDGDVFGASVNLAARVAAEAHPGEVLGTRAVANAADEHGVAVVELGEVTLKNVKDAVLLYSLGFMLGDYDTPIDPVCRVPLDRRSAVGNLQYRGHQYWFCSLECAAAFASNPRWHTAASLKPAARAR